MIPISFRISERFRLFQEVHYILYLIYGLLFFNFVKFFIGRIVNFPCRHFLFLSFFCLLLKSHDRLVFPYASSAPNFSRSSIAPAFFDNSSFAVA